MKLLGASAFVLSIRLINSALTSAGHDQDRPESLHRRMDQPPLRDSDAQDILNQLKHDAQLLQSNDQPPLRDSDAQDILNQLKHDDQLLQRNDQPPLRDSDAQDISNPRKKLKHDFQRLQNIDFALRNWFDLEPSQDKLYQLKTLLNNPTVDFSLEDSYIYDQILDLNDLESLKKIGQMGISPSPSALSKAYRMENREFFNYLSSISSLPDHELITFAAKDGNLNWFADLTNGKAVTERELKLAFKSGNLDLVRFIIEEKKIRTMLNHLTYALENGVNLKIVQSLIQDSNLPITPDALRQSVIGGNLDVVRHLVQNKPDTLSYSNIYSNDVINGGKKDVFDYIMGKGLIPLFEYAIRNTRIGENLDVDLASHLIQQYRWDPFQTTIFGTREINLNENTQLIKYFLENDESLTTTLDMVTNAKRIGHGYRSLQEFNNYLNLISRRARDTPTTHHLKDALKKKNIDAAKYLVEHHRVDPDQVTFKYANKQWLHFLVDGQYVSIQKTLENIAYSADVDLFKYILNKGGKLDLSILNNAAFGGNMDLFNYIISQGVIPDGSTLDAAQSNIIGPRNPEIVTKLRIMGLQSSRHNRAPPDWRALQNAGHLH